MEFVVVLVYVLVYVAVVTVLASVVLPTWGRNVVATTTREMQQQQKRGPTGEKGKTGREGSLGWTGPFGGIFDWTGATGPTGSVSVAWTGHTGQPGDKGATGGQGFAAQGDITGAAGFTGWQGPTGPLGATGSTGPTGLGGLQGPTGATGSQGPRLNTGPIPDFVWLRSLGSWTIDQSNGAFYPDWIADSVNGRIFFGNNIVTHGSGLGYFDGFGISVSFPGVYIVSYEIQVTIPASSTTDTFMCWLSYVPATNPSIPVGSVKTINQHTIQRASPTMYETYSAQITLVESGEILLLASTTSASSSFRITGGNLSVIRMSGLS